MKTVPSTVLATGILLSAAEAATCSGLSDTLNGGVGDDTILGGLATSADLLIGAGGADHIEGGTCDDTLIGGPGDDSLYGGEDDDTYIFELGDAGMDLLVEEVGGGIDTLVFDESLTFADLFYSPAGDDLVIDWGVGTIVVMNQLLGGEEQGVEFVQFGLSRFTLDGEAAPVPLPGLALGFAAGAAGLIARRRSQRLKG